MHRRSAPYQNPQDFSRLYEQAHLTVYRYIYSLHGGPQQEVEDLTADTFWRAWKARKRFEGSAKAAVGWLLKIAKRLVIDDYRRHKVRGFTLEIDDNEPADGRPGPEERTALDEELSTLMNLMEDLPVEQREILILRYILGWRVKDIGEHMEIAENTVSVTIRRALEKLRKQWPEGLG